MPRGQQGVRMRWFWLMLANISTIPSKFLGTYRQNHRRSSPGKLNQRVAHMLTVIWARIFSTSLSRVTLAIKEIKFSWCMYDPWLDNYLHCHVQWDGSFSFHSYSISENDVLFGQLILKNYYMVEQTPETMLRRSLHIFKIYTSYFLLLRPYIQQRI